MRDFAWSTFYRDHRRKINVSVATAIVIILIWPVPVIVSKFEASKFQRRCVSEWQRNAETFKDMKAAKNVVDYVGMGLNFTHTWTFKSNDPYWDPLGPNFENAWTSNYPSPDLYCFRNLYPDHLMAIQHFEGALLEYNRQSSLANFDMAPPEFYYPQFSKVEYRCDAPGLWNRRWSTWCQTFLNVP